MNMIGCLDVPTSGRYWIDGVEGSKMKDNQLADLRKNAAFLFEPEQAWGQDHGSDPRAATGVEAAFAKINPDIKLD